MLCRSELILCSCYGVWVGERERCKLCIIEVLDEEVLQIQTQVNSYLTPSGA